MRWVGGGVSRKPFVTGRKPALVKLGCGGPSVKVELRIPVEEVASRIVDVYEPGEGPSPGVGVDDDRLDVGVEAVGGALGLVVGGAGLSFGGGYDGLILRSLSSVGPRL